MPFDLSTAKPVSRFDISTAQPVHEGMTHEGTGRFPTQQDIQDAIAQGQLPDVFRNPEQGLQGGVPTENVTGLGLSPFDLVGLGLPAKLALGAKVGGGALASLLGATAIGSRASEGAKFPALASALSGQRGATAWHGSPHLFDAFKNEAIGTGEGAQSYGHGLYLAENKAVGTEYMNALSKYHTTLNGVPLTPDNPQFAAAMHIGSQGYDKALQMTQNAIDNKFLTPEYGAQELEKIKALKGADIQAKLNGYLYKTDIPDAHIDKMLDWDKPLSEQHPDVQAAIKGIEPNMHPSDRMQTAGNWYANISRPGLGKVGDDYEVSKALQQAGIPGIKYLDGSSRTAGEGTRNFVIFDPEHIRILERNGQPTGLVPWSDDVVDKAIADVPSTTETSYELAHEAAHNALSKMAGD